MIFHDDFFGSKEIISVFFALHFFANDIPGIRAFDKSEIGFVRPEIELIFLQIKMILFQDSRARDAGCPL